MKNKRKLKIAMLSANFPPYFGGIGNACYHNALELAKHGHEVTVFTRKYGQAFHYEKNIKVVQLKPLFCFGNAVLLPQMPWKLKGFDVLHVHAPFHFGLEIAFVASKLYGTPLVISYQMDLVGKGWLKWFFRLHEALCIKPIVKRANAVIVSSSDYAEHSNLSTIFSALSQKKKLFAVPNGVNLKEFSPRIGGSSIRKRLCGKGETLVLFVGALDKAHYFKGVGFLLKAFAKIKNKNAKLLVVGEGDLKQKYASEAKELGISERAVFAGGVSEADLPKYYSLCDFLVLPSINKGEAFGIVLVEAMACGKPVIASDLPGMRSIVDSDKNGLLFKAHNESDLIEKMNRLLKDKKLCAHLGKNGRKKAEREYDWKKIAKRIGKVYSEVVNE